MQMNALIAGATGLVGTELLKMLVDSDGYDKVHVLNRRKIGYGSSKVEEHVIDFDELAAFEPGQGINHVFCCLGTTIKKAGTKENFRKVDLDYVVDLARKAKQINAPKFLVISALGASEKSAIFYNRVKGEMEQAVREIAIPCTFIFRPSLLMGDRKENRTGEKTAVMVYKVLNPLFIGKLKKYKGIRAEKVARAMIETAKLNDNEFQILESDEIQEF